MIEVELWLQKKNKKKYKAGGVRYRNRIKVELGGVIGRNRWKDKDICRRKFVLRESGNDNK